MAYPTYPGMYGYNGMMPNPQDQYMQRLNNLMQQTQMPQQQTQSLIRVTGIEGARAYPMPPNSAAALFDGNDDIMYIKSTDGASFPTIKAFRFTPIDAPAPVQSGDYVTRQEFEQLKGMIFNAQQPVSAESKSATDTNVGTKHRPDDSAV